MNTRNVNILSTKSFDIYCGRAKGVNSDPRSLRSDQYGVWGNPVKIGSSCVLCGSVHNDAGSTLPCYETYLRERLSNDIDFNLGFYKIKDKTLGCFCKPGPCHTDVMVKYLEAPRIRVLTPEKITHLKSDEVFVFGSNTTGFHGSGAAGLAFRNNPDFNWRSCKFFLKAMNSKPGSIDRVGMWAVYGVGEGFMKGRKGMSYGIITVTQPGKKRSVPLSMIQAQIDRLIQFATENPQLKFYVTKIGCHLAGYTVDEIKKLFVDQFSVPDNIILPFEFEFRA